MMEFTYRQPLTATEIFEIAEASYAGSPWSQKIFEHDLANEHARYLVVLADTIPVGFVAGTLIIDELSISNVAILPKYQGKNIATNLLIKWFESFATGTRILLEVRASNLAAQNLYRKLGFQQMTVRKEYYQHPVEDALIMEKKL